MYNIINNNKNTVHVCFGSEMKVYVLVRFELFLQCFLWKENYLQMHNNKLTSFTLLYSVSSTNYLYFSLLAQIMLAIFHRKMVWQLSLSKWNTGDRHCMGVSQHFISYMIYEHTLEYSRTLKLKENWSHISNQQNTRLAIDMLSEMLNSQVIG